MKQGESFTPAGILEYPKFLNSGYIRDSLLPTYHHIGSSGERNKAQRSIYV